MQQHHHPPRPYKDNKNCNCELCIWTKHRAAGISIRNENIPCKQQGQKLCNQPLWERMVCPSNPCNVPERKGMPNKTAYEEY